jgi:hypothetical protein
MNRCQFLSSSLVPLVATSMNASPAAAHPLPPPLPFQTEKSKLKITGIRMVRPQSKRPIPTYTPAPGSWSTGGVEVANPMSIYPKYKAQRSLFMAEDLGPEWVEITTDKGVKGFGFGGPGAGLSRSISPSCFSVKTLQGRAALGHLWRSTLYYGRKGLVVHAISAVDNALWDIIGNALGMPVYKAVRRANQRAYPRLLHGKLTSSSMRSLGTRKSSSLFLRAGGRP